MDRTIISNIKQAICSKAFFIGVSSFVLLLFFSSIESITEVIRSDKLLENGFHGTFVLDALGSDAVMLVLPILCALPFTASFVDDTKGGFIKSYLVRTTKRGYVTGKMIGCALSGGLILLLGILIAYALSALCFMPMEATVAVGEIAKQTYIGVFNKAILFFFSGAFWALVGMTFATLTNSKYMAYASPFIIYYVLIIFSERYFENLYVIYPKEWLKPSAHWVFGNLSIILLLSELIAIVSFGFAIAAKRRIDNV